MLSRKDLHGYQEIIFNWIINNVYCGVFAEMGLGKTISVLTVLQVLLYEELEIKKVLIVAPKRVVLSVWHKEINKFSHTNGLTISRIIGNPMQRKRALAEKTDIHIISRDNLVWLIGLYGGSMLPYDVLIVDESSSFKNRKTNRFKSLRNVLDSFKRIVILSGTPTPKSLLDLWSQIFILDRGKRLGSGIGKYRRKYFDSSRRPGRNFDTYSIKEMADDEIYEKVKDICISLKVEDFPEINLPERVDNIIEIEMPALLRKKYDTFEKEKILEFYDSDSIVADNGSALMAKLCQFANGAIYENVDEEVNKRREYKIVHDLKLEALEEIIESSSGKPILIQYAYKHDCERILNRFKHLKPVKFKTEQDVDDWNAGNIQLMVMHPASGGHGINLQFGGNIMVWFGLTWDLEYYLQANARLHRQGQLSTTYVHHIITKGTYDENVMRALKNKDAIQESLMKAIKFKMEKYAKLR